MTAGAGIGLRAPHHAELLIRLPRLALIEVHSENHFGLGGAPLQLLREVREHYPLSLHGVGLSLGSADALDRAHLQKLGALIDQVQPALVSEHLSWNAIDGEHWRDLLPLPHTEAAITHLVSRIGQVQDTLRRPLLVENVSSYLRLAQDECPEWEFVREVARRSGCQLLLDINNVYVNACNHDFDAETYLAALPADLVAEIHLGGHCPKELAGGKVWLDTHDAPVAAPVWDLYQFALKLWGAKPTLVEWDSQLPPLDLLLAEAARAQTLIDASTDTSS
ncbi:MAG: DUF692 domain-containing protein [Lysobacterales bacterium]